ncbi:MAG TPA: RagB/SusD family nutrient uptake outer membrane protein, partial [Ferruginibacter sp.]|nr:RagB/SusD family nutrient uptake outer membrane protein [Ferruginibacter sp.]
GNASGNISAGQLTLQFVLDERARELYWEGHRRTDLIRYGVLTNNAYLWPWKGGVSSGTGVDSKYNLFPIPSSNLVANPNLTQNTGY